MRCCCYCARTPLPASLLSPPPSRPPSLASSPLFHLPIPPPTSEFAAVEYLISSCGLPSDKAIPASRYISHLKSPQKPDAALQFLRDAGVTAPHITAAALRDPSFLGYSVDKCFKPRLAELLQLGFSPSDISLLLSLCPTAFRHSKLPQKIQFWLPILGSLETLLLTLKRNQFLLTVNLENSAIPNLSFLQEHCGFSVPQIARLVKSAPRALTSSPEALKMNAKRAQELGVRCPSPMFVYALKTVCSLNQRNVDARLSNLIRQLGLSQNEVITLVSRLPSVLNLRDEVMRRKIEFLTKEVGFDKMQLVNNPSMLTYSLEKRLIPRSRVRKLLELKGLPVANLKFVSFVQPSKKVFVEKFVMPYEDAIPGLHRAYADACAGSIAGLEWFDRSLQLGS